jgi:hypothetical protein
LAEYAESAAGGWLVADVRILPQDKVRHDSCGGYDKNKGFHVVGMLIRIMGATAALGLIVHLGPGRDYV